MRARARRLDPLFHPVPLDHGHDCDKWRHGDLIIVLVNDRDRSNGTSFSSGRIRRIRQVRFADRCLSLWSRWSVHPFVMDDELIPTTGTGSGCWIC